MIPVPSLPEDTLREMKQRFDELLRNTQREGIDSLIAYLESTDFYTAPASTQRHGAIRGGLLRHSLSVHRYVQNFLKPFEGEIPEESMIIAGLLHDVCKANFYTTRVRNVKIPGERRWEEEESFTIEDQFPIGHGEKSVIMIMRHIALTDDEIYAIRWHMGGYDDAARQYASGRAQSSAFERCKLAVALNIADMYVAHLVEH